MTPRRRMTYQKLMTKMNFKKGLLIFTISVFGMTLFFQNADAVVGNMQSKKEEKKADMAAAREEKRTEIQARVCENISGLATRFNERVNEKGDKIRIKKQERENNWEEKLVEIDNRLTTLRNTRDEAWEKHFSKLEEKAESDVQKKAVSDFKSSVKKAIEARRAAINAAMTTFRNGVKNLIATRKNGLAKAVESYQAAQKAAFEKAKTDCVNGVDPKTVRTNLHASLKTARDKFNTEKQAVEKVGTSMDALIKAKKEAMEKAKADFHAAMEKARTDFKKAFPDDTDSEE